MTTTPDATVVTGPNFQQSSVGAMLVTPTNGTQATLAALFGNAAQITGGTISGVALDGATIGATTPVVSEKIKAGTGTGTYQPAGVLSVNLTSTGNGADTTEDTLMSFSLPANTLSAVGKALKIRAWGSCAANADNKTMRLYFGSEVIATPTAATNAKNWWLELEIFKTAANTQRVVGRGIVDTTSVTPLDTTGAETDTGAITIKITGQAGTGNANDIVADVLIVEMLS